MNIHPADIVGIPFPFSDMSTHKRRPVLVLTTQDDRGDFVGIAVTSALTVNMALCIDDASMIIGCLPKKSWVRFDKIFTLNTSLVKNKYGTLKKDSFLTVVQGVCDFLGCHQ
jgi:mRNA interferase MazF